MALDSLRKRLRATAADLDRDRLQDRYRGVGLTPIGQVVPRAATRLGGEIQEIRVLPRRGSQSVEVTVADGTGQALALFTGRTGIPGLHLGAGLVIEGVFRLERSRLIAMNPAYRLLG